MAIVFRTQWAFPRNGLITTGGPTSLAARWPRDTPIPLWCNRTAQNPGMKVGPIAGSDQGALPGLLLVGFPGPPAEPGVLISQYRALHVS
jgi:hypothetical protein